MIKLNDETYVNAAEVIYIAFANNDCVIGLSNKPDIHCNYASGDVAVEALGETLLDIGNGIYIVKDKVQYLDIDANKYLIKLSPSLIIKTSEGVFNYLKNYTVKTPKDVEAKLNEYSASNEKWKEEVIGDGFYKKANGIVFSSGNNDYIHNFTEKGTTDKYYTIVGNISTSKGTVEYKGLTLTSALKIESNTSITFTAFEKGKLTLVFNKENSNNIKVDNVNYVLTEGILELELEVGVHTITKSDTANLFYIDYLSYNGGNYTDILDLSNLTYDVDYKNNDTSDPKTVQFKNGAVLRIPVNTGESITLYGYSGYSSYKFTVNGQTTNNLSNTNTSAVAKYAQDILITSANNNNYYIGLIYNNVNNSDMTEKIEKIEEKVNSNVKRLLYVKQDPVSSEWGFGGLETTAEALNIFNGLVGNTLKISDVNVMVDIGNASTEVTYEDIINPLVEFNSVLGDESNVYHLYIYLTEYKKKLDIHINANYPNTLDIDVAAYDPFGTKVVANPTLAGTEAELTGLEVDGTKYAMPSGGSELYRHMITLSQQYSSVVQKFTVSFVVICNIEDEFTLLTFSDYYKSLGYKSFSEANTHGYLFIPCFWNIYDISGDDIKYGKILFHNPFNESTKWSYVGSIYMPVPSKYGNQGSMSAGTSEYVPISGYRDDIYNFIDTVTKI